MSRLDLVVGPNGAGRSTFVELVLSDARPGVAFVSADVIAAERRPEDPLSHGHDAAQAARRSRTLPGTASRSAYQHGMLTRVATEQIAVRIPEEQLSALDDLVARGVYDTRAAAVRAGIEALLELDRRRQADQTIVEGYRRIPPTEAERAAAMASMREAITNEPWRPNRGAARSGGARSKMSVAGRSS